MHILPILNPVIILNNIVISNLITNFNMDEYIQNKLKDYLKELQENNFKINSGRKLELITAYKNNSLLYEDVPEYIKDKYNLPSRDEGIDVIKLNNEEIIETYQCKDYNGRVSNHKLGTYFGFHLYQLKNIPFNVVGSTNTVFNSTIKPIIYDVNENFGEYIEETKEVCVLDNLRWYQNECIEKIEKLYLDLTLDSNNDEDSILESISSLYEEVETDINVASKINSENTSITDSKINIENTSITDSKINIENISITDSKINIENKSPIITNKEFRIKIPCSCKKTAIMYYFGFINYNILILVPKINIAVQIKNYFENNLNKVVNTYWTNTDKNNNSNVTICVYDSVDKIKFNKYDMIFVDEAHHIIGSKLYKYYNEVIQIKESYIDTIKNLECTLKIYLSATINVKHIENSYELDFNRAIKEGYLSDYEFNILYVEPDFEENYRKLVKIIKENKEYKHIIIYCNRIETAERINELLNKHEIISHVIVSKSENCSELKREHILEDFRNGLVKVLCSVNCLNEGTDLPIADTCMFVNDRGSEINIIQCIGRVLRKYKYKSKARIVLFDTNKDSAELKYENYMRVIDKIDSGFRQNLNHKLKIYNYSRDYKFDLKIKEKEDQYFDKIIRFRLTDKDKLKLCQEFYDKYGRLPKQSAKYNDFNIGYFINRVRCGDYKKILDKVKQIFKEHWIDGDIREYRYKQHLELCKQFYKEHKRLPKKEEKYKNQNIGSFIYRTKGSKDENKIKDLERIFKIPLIVKKQIKTYTYEEKLKLTSEFYNLNHRMPRTREKYGEFGIEHFVSRIRRYNKDENKINDLKQIFKEHWIDGNVFDYQYNKYLKLCKQFYDEFHRLPKQIEKYNGWNIGIFISEIKARKKNKIKDLEEIFHCKFE